MGVTRHQWRVIGASSCGAAHLRSGLPNQDALAWLPQAGNGPPIVAAIADGHGGAKYCRSDIGARLAVQIVCALLTEFVEHVGNAANLSIAKRIAEERVPREIARLWTERILQHIESMPLTERELQHLQDREGIQARRIIELNPIMAYGATVLAVVVTQTFVLYIQLGDGDMLTVSNSGEVVRPSIPSDDRLFANETTSLCQPDAWRDVRTCFQVLLDEPPALIFLTTDGFANSFQDEAGFFQVGADMLDILRADGLEAVNARLDSWLAEVSRAGSGDDITMAILCHLDGLKLPALIANQQGSARQSDDTISTEKGSSQA